MLTEIRFHNFRVLSDASLKLGPFTLIVGPNGCGKSTALQSFTAMQQADGLQFASLTSIDSARDLTADVGLTFAFQDGQPVGRKWLADPAKQMQYLAQLRGSAVPKELLAIRSARIFSLDPVAIAEPTQVKAQTVLQSNGGGLAGVLQDMRDQHPERFEGLVDELRRWLPDYNHLLFQTPRDNFKSVSLRTTVGHYAIPASDLSHGTLFALAMLTIAYLPEPPAIVGVEEPDRGMHPRLLREVRDALYRVASPDSTGESRPAVQVIATTHSPYMVDLFRDHPEEVVLAQRDGLHATLTRLTDQPNWDEIIQDAQLGDLWYSGVLGGVPVGA